MLQEAADKQAKITITLACFFQGHLALEEAYDWKFAHALTNTMKIILCKSSRVITQQLFNHETCTEHGRCF